MTAGVDAGEGGVHQAADRRKMPGRKEIGKILRNYEVRIAEYAKLSKKNAGACRAEKIRQSVDIAWRYFS